MNARNWVGRAEDLFSPPGPDGSRPPYTFPSGSTQITLYLSLTDPAVTVFPEAVGQLVFGDAPVPAPAAGVAYPPGLQQSGGDLASIPPLEGFAYQLTDGSSAFATAPTEGALRTGYMPSELYKDWCMVQPPRARMDGSGTYDCITPMQEPIDETASWCRSYEGTYQLTYDCTIGWLCQACQCGKRGCQADYSSEPVTLWLVRSGDDLLGTLVRAVFDYGKDYLPIGNVRFRRQAQ